MAADDCVKGLLIGGLLGAAVGILYAPKSGKETRDDIRHSAEELLDKAKSRYEEAYRTLEKLAEQEKESCLGKKDRLRKAFEAGVEAFRAEQAGAR
ncbi:MAG: YtxH domain-containing protein [Syntrophales bacterium]